MEEEAEKLKEMQAAYVKALHELPDGAEIPMEMMETQESINKAFFKYLFISFILIHLCVILS